MNSSNHAARARADRKVFFYKGLSLGSCHPSHLANSAKMTVKVDQAERIHLDHKVQSK